MSYATVIGLFLFGYILLTWVGKAARRYAVFGSTLVLTSALVLSVEEVRGTPASWTAAPPDTTVLAYTFIEGEAIFLWLDLNGAPFSIKLPWSTRAADQLEQAHRKAQEDGGNVKTGASFDESWKDQQMFYAEPVSPLPEKD